MPPWAITDAPGSAMWMARLATLQELRAFTAGGQRKTDDDFEEF